MENNTLTDTLLLLKECDSGTKMAIYSIDEVVEKINDSNMRQLLIESREHHEKLDNEIQSLLTKYDSEEQEPALMAKGMSWLKTNIKTTLDERDSVIADLMTDGCNMGIKSLNKYLNKYYTANNSSKRICIRLIGIEEELEKDLRAYL